LPSVRGFIEERRSSVTGIAAGVGDDGCAVAAIDTPPCALSGRVDPDERSRRGTAATRDGVEEETADDGVVAVEPRELDDDVAGQLPDEILAIVEAALCTAVEQSARRGIANVDTLHPTALIPVDAIERELVGLTVGEVDV